MANTNSANTRINFPKGISDNGGCIRIRFTYKKTRHTIIPGLQTTKENVKVAGKILDQIRSDIAMNQFDETCQKYLPQSKLRKGEEKLVTGIYDLFKLFCAFKKTTVKESTYHAVYEPIRLHLSDVNWNHADIHKLMQVHFATKTTPDQCRRIAMYLNAAYKWGVKRGYVDENYAEGLAEEYPKPNYMVNPEPNPFTVEEKLEIIAEFGNSTHYDYYGDFVWFLFLTGCRPGEAIALEWSDIDLQKKSISFNKSLTQVAGKQFLEKGTKTNKARMFPMGTLLHDILKGLPSFDNGLVFPAPEGGYINYNNFTRRAWKSIVKPIKDGTTPYCCRDTFITEQCLIHQIPPIQVAKWVGNSVETIEKYYLGNQLIDGVVPGEDVSRNN